MSIVNTFKSVNIINILTQYAVSIENKLKICITVIHLQLISQLLVNHK